MRAQKLYFLTLSLLIYFLSCDMGSEKSTANETNPPKNDQINPPKKSSTEETNPPKNILPLRVAVIYTKGKNQMYMNAAYEFPINKTSASDEKFKQFSEMTLQKNVVARPEFPTPQPDNFTISLVKKLTIADFGIIYIFYWNSYEMARGNRYTNAYSLMVTDDGGHIAAEKFFGSPVSENERISSQALRYILLDAALVNELHHDGFTIPGEEDLYQTLKSIDPKIDVSKYPDLGAQ